MTDEVLTMPEIERRYPDEWILIGDPIKDKDLNVLAGKVLFHSPDRDEMYDKAVELKPGNFASHFTGKPPKDMEFVL